MSTQERDTSKPDAMSDTHGTPSHRFQGKIVSVTGNKLVMTNKEGKEHTHTLASGTKLTCDGNVCEPKDLKAGNRIRVITRRDDRTVAASVETIDKEPRFAQRH